MKISRQKIGDARIWESNKQKLLGVRIDRTLFFDKHVSNLCKKAGRKLSVFRSSGPEVFCEKDVLGNFAKFTGKHLCQSLFFNKVAGAACSFIKKETLAQVFSYEFCEISKNTFSHRTPLVAASVF